WRQTLLSELSWNEFPTLISRLIDLSGETTPAFEDSRNCHSLSLSRPCALNSALLGRKLPFDVVDLCSPDSVNSKFHLNQFCLLTRAAAHSASDLLEIRPVLSHGVASCE